jgi:hypothetical protein
MRYRFVGNHLETLDDGQSLEPGAYIELSDVQIKESRASELLERDLLIEVDEGEGPTDAAEALAKEHKIDLSKVAGTGAGGRVTKTDVENYIEQKKGDG